MIVRNCVSGTLRKLQKKHNCVGIKTSFEDEGASFDDVIRLRKITSSNNLKLAIKIGGAEAKTDIRMASDLCCDSIVGPMIESEYAFSKYMQSVGKCGIAKGVNIETITAVNNIDLILSSQHISSLDYFVVGRVDLVGSMNKQRDFVDSSENLEIIENLFRKMKRRNKKTYLGGALSSNSRNFVEHLFSRGLLDYIETRFIIMKLDEEFFDDFDEAIKTSHQFELDWMTEMHAKYSDISESYKSRVDLILPRVKNSIKINKQDVSYNLDDINSKVIKLKDYSVTFDNSDITKYINRDDFIIIDKKLVHFVKGYPNVYQIDAIEENKTIHTVMDIISKLNSNRVVVIGGGLVQDVGSFASSIFKRGIEWIYFPTTLLAMADSCIGSKTSLNTSVKNKIGTYHSPKEIYINTNFLNTLSTSHIQSGLGEILKLSMIGNRLDEYEQYKGDFENLIKLALIIKRSVIEIDLYDKGIRKGLNYGHTLGHVLEVLSNYTIPHGVAVVHGMLLVNKLFGYNNKRFEDLCRKIAPEKPIIDKTRLRAVLLEDKKASGNSIQFIVPVRPGETEFISVDATVYVPKILNLL